MITDTELHALWQTMPNAHHVDYAKAVLKMAADKCDAEEFKKFWESMGYSNHFGTFALAVAAWDTAVRSCTEVRDE